MVYLTMLLVAVPIWHWTVGW